MAFAFDEIFAYGGQLIVAAKKRVPKALGIGREKIDHSAYIEGNTQIGKVDAFSSADATLMVGREDTKGTSRSLHTKGNVRIEGDGGTPNALNMTGDMLHNGNTVHNGDKTHNGNLITSNLQNCTGSSCSWSGSSINVQGWKGFDIKHPSKERHRLRHICLEGPEGAIYYRGRTNKNTIALPPYWKDLVDTTTITVSLTPIGAHQDIIVKRWDDEFIYLQAQGGMPINAFFHVFAARSDGERLIPEYEGDTPEDYPGDNTQYSIAGYHYDRRTL